MRDWQRTSIELAAAASFDPTLSELVKLRASQINGCANCINLHAVEARENGETEQRFEARYAAHFFDRSIATKRFKRGMDAHNHPDFYRQLGQVPEQIVADALAALQARFNL
jgi:AhpD family alkylhydroperoxidase